MDISVTLLPAQGFFFHRNQDEAFIEISSDFKITNNRCYKNLIILNPEQSHFMCTGEEIHDPETLKFQ